MTQFCWSLLIVYYIQDFCTSDNKYIGGVLQIGNNIRCRKYHKSAGTDILVWQIQLDTLCQNFGYMPDYRNKVNK